MTKQPSVETKIDKIWEYVGKDGENTYEEAVALTVALFSTQQAQMRDKIKGWVNHRLETGEFTYDESKMALKEVLDFLAITEED